MKEKDKPAFEQVSFEWCIQNMKLMADWVFQIAPSCDGIHFNRKGKGFVMGVKVRKSKKRKRPTAKGGKAR